MVIIEIAEEAVAAWGLKMVFDGETIVQCMAHPVEVLEGKAWDMRDLLESRNSIIDSIKIQEITSVDAAHEALEMAKFEVAEEQEFADVSGSVHAEHWRRK